MNERTNEYCSERSAEETRPILHINHLKQTRRRRPVSDMAIRYVAINDSSLGDTVYSAAV